MSQSSVDHCERENVSILPTAVEDLTAVTISRKEAWKSMKKCNVEVVEEDSAHSLSPAFLLLFPCWHIFPTLLSSCCLFAGVKPGGTP